MRWFNHLSTGWKIAAPMLVTGALMTGIVVTALTALEATPAGPAVDPHGADYRLMLLAMLTVIGMLISDLALAALDPRIRFEGGQAR